MTDVGTSMELEVVFTGLLRGILVCALGLVGVLFFTLLGGGALLVRSRTSSRR